MSQRVRVCMLGELPPGQMLALDVPGQDPLAVHNVGGTLYVTSNLCTHGMTMLSDGFLDGEEVVCPLHGGRFNVRTGEATEFPCEDPLETRPVLVEEGVAYIEV